MESELVLLCNITTPYQNLALHYVNSIYQIFQARNLIIHDPSLSLVSEADKSLNGFIFVVSMCASPLLLLSTALCLRTQTWSLTVGFPSVLYLYLTSCVILRKLCNMFLPQFPDLYNGDYNCSFHGCCED